MERLGFAKRHGEAGIHQLEAERQRHVLEARLDRREVVAGRQGTRLQLPQRLGLGVDGHDAPAATQHLDHVAAIAAAEIDGERPGRAGTEPIERRDQRAARRPLAQLLVVGRPVS